MGFEKMKEFVHQNLEAVPPNVHWRLFMELADAAKRESTISQSRKCYRQATLLQPHASHAWLEYAKLEEECGYLEKCQVNVSSLSIDSWQEILRTGLSYCPFNENLVVKAIKLEEKLGNLENARSILARLKYISLDKAWRIMLEGSLLEARAGNVDVARRIIQVQETLLNLTVQYLLENTPQYGSIFLEASTLEERCGEYQRAIEIAEKGLQENPRYGPLYLTVLRLYEKVSNGDLTKTREVVERAIKVIPKVS